MAKVAPVPDGGMITFFGNGERISGCSDVAVNKQTGLATCSTTYFSAGPVSVQAYYSGYDNFDAVASRAYSETVQLPTAGLLACHPERPGVRLGRGPGAR